MFRNLSYFDVLSNLYAFEFMRMHKGTIYEDLPDKVSYEDMHELYVKFNIYKIVHDRELESLIELTKDLRKGIDLNYAIQQKEYANYIISNGQFTYELYIELITNLNNFIDSN